MIYAMKIFVKLYVENWNIMSCFCHIYVSMNEKNIELELEYFGMCLDVLIQIYFNVE